MVVARPHDPDREAALAIIEVPNDPFFAAQAILLAGLVLLMLFAGVQRWSRTEPGCFTLPSLAVTNSEGARDCANPTPQAEATTERMNSGDGRV